MDRLYSDGVTSLYLGLAYGMRRKVEGDPDNRIVRYVVVLLHRSHWVLVKQGTRR